MLIAAVLLAIVLLAAVVHEHHEARLAREVQLSRTANVLHELSRVQARPRIGADPSTGVKLLRTER